MHKKFKAVMECGGPWMNIPVALLQEYVKRECYNCKDEVWAKASCDPEETMLLCMMCGPLVRHKVFELFGIDMPVVDQSSGKIERAMNWKAN